MMQQQARLSHMIMGLRHSHDQLEAVPALTRVIDYTMKSAEPSSIDITTCGQYCLITVLTSTNDFAETVRG
jgi:hypothetical protein